MPDPINLAVVGYGYWGPNIVRNVIERPELELWGLCELNPERVGEVRRRYPGARTCDNFDEVLADPDGRRGLDRHAAARPTTRSSSRRSRPASTCSSRSRWRRPPPTPRRSWSWPTARASC